MTKNKSQSKRSENYISRRTFINHAAAGSAVVVLKPLTNLATGDLQQYGKWSGDASSFRFHMIGHAHIDPVWLWPWPEGLSVVHSTFRSALDRMKETPDFTFVASSAQFYQWISENDPSMLVEIRKRVDEGRWNIVGGWWVEPDVNIPCGESLVRQGLYGQLTLQHLLGRRAKVASNPDSFGHANTLPQILRLQGMNDYVFMRPGRHEKSLPADIFWWEGADGTRILTYRIPISYNDEGHVRKRIENILENYRNQPVKSFMAYYGVGDHGGGATKENILSINELKTEKGAPEILYSTPEKYFKEIREMEITSIPVVNDDLQHRAVGCYTAESEIKKGNRHAEAALLTAEKIAAIASAVWGTSYPMRELTSAWQKVLFLQFHDSLAGTSIPQHSQTAREGFGYALEVAHHATYLSVQKLEWQVPAEDPDSQYLLVFNPHVWEIHDYIEYDLGWNLSDPSYVVDENDNPLLHQWIPGSAETGNRKRLIVSVILPPFGYRQIRLMKGKQSTIKSGARANENKLENEFLQVSFSTSGGINIFDKENRKEVFPGSDKGCRAVIIDDPSDTWSHDISSYSNEVGTFGNATIKILENGPLRAVIRVTTSYGASKLYIDWILYSDSRSLEARVTLDWHEHLKMLKFSFPVEVESPTATYETPYGHIERAANGDENPGQRWIDLSGQWNSITYGLTVINDAKYGYSVNGNDIRISIARSAVYAHHKPTVLDLKSEHQWMDQGIQTFRMLLVPHTGSWKENNIVRKSEEFMAPSIVIYQGIHKGSMPKSASLISVDARNVIVSAIKRAENGNYIIIRCVETLGLPVTATLDVRFIDRKWTGNFRPCEIKTLRLDPVSGNLKEVDLMEE
jgi:alpha-mannosidase